MDRASWVLISGLLVGCGDADETSSDYALPEAPRCAIAAPEPGALASEGSALVDQHGRVVTLRGVNAGGRSKFAPYSPFDYESGAFGAALAEYLDRAERWGFDVLRVPFSWEAVEPQQDSWDEEFLDRYDQLLDAAWDRGMWTIVDFHQDIYAEAFCGDGFPAWTLTDPPAPHHDCPDWFLAYSTNDDVKAAFDAFWSDASGARTEFAEMWEMMATRHADRAGVIGYEIINEPSSGSASSFDWEQDVLSPFYTEYIERIQGHDADALVFFDASGIQAVFPGTDMPRPEGSNIVFAPHFYDQGALFGGDVNENVRDPLAVWRDQGVDWDVPVLIGEFGVTAEHHQVREHALRMYEALDELGLHATWWEYSEAVELWNEEDLSLVGPAGDERADMLAAVVRPYPRALAGRVANSRFDGDRGHYELTYDAASAADGVSEIVLPTGLYEAEPRIGAQGACVDVQGDRLLVQSDPDATEVAITVDRAE
ncbi:MAG: cellulase family glycosylhydrolase [Deltaproteobacteria bacterium]|jgi:endoglycosylceramidase|nr:cellulase family glycosylhydrolase [Deltaproteobacteria bacterium]MBW2534413.1 cellulase family glycosylhydrolase [Deltaproteobacteria bacterium]